MTNGLTEYPHIEPTKLVAVEAALLRINPKCYVGLYSEIIRVNRSKPQAPKPPPLPCGFSDYSILLNEQTKNGYHQTADIRLSGWEL